MKKTLSAILTAALLLSSMAGCSGGGSSSSGDPSAASSSADSSSQAAPSSSGAESQPAANEPVILKGWGAKTFTDATGITSYNEQLAWQLIEEKTGIKVDWTVVTAANNNASTQFGLLMASNDLPDFFVDINPLQLEEFGRKGALIPLEEYMQNDMPSFSALMETDPNARGEITSADGHIYFFPRLHNNVATRCWPGFMIRQDWLEQAGLEVPETTEEFYQALKAIKEKVPTCTKPYTGDIKPLVWAFGVGSRGTGNANDDFFIEDGDLKYGPTDPRYKDALEYLNKLYAEGLIDPEWNGISGDQITTNMVTEMSASSFGSFAGALGKYNQLLSADGKGTPLVAVAPLIGPTGTRGTQGMHTSIDPGYGGAITVACKNPEAVVRLFDYTYGEEGRLCIYFGREGDTYTMVDGVPTYTEKVTGSEFGTLDYLNNYVANVSCYPSCLPTEQYRATLSEAGIKGNEETTQYAGELKVPSLRFSDTEIANVNAILRDLNAYVDENFAAFVSGQKGFDQWDAFQAGFEKLRLEELGSIYQASYERFKEAIK